MTTEKTLYKSLFSLLKFVTFFGLIDVLAETQINKGESIIDPNGNKGNVISMTAKKVTNIG
jgi:hypothetical protein